MIRPVPITGVVLNSSIEKSPHLLPCARLARTPRLAHSAGPIKFRFQAKIRDRQRRGPCDRGSESFWGALGCSRTVAGQTGPPESAEYLEGFSVGVQNRPGFE